MKHQLHSPWSDTLLRGKSFHGNCFYAPYFRLVSAYQDKLVDYVTPNMEKYVSSMKQNFGNVTFDAFVQTILKLSETKCQKMNQCGLNVHWRPYIRNYF